MASNATRIIMLGAIATLLAACGGGSSSSMAPAPVSMAQNGNVSMLVSDASTEDWATIGVKILSIALVPQGGGANVTVYTAPSPVPTTNLVMLDQLGELLGNATVPTGTYTSAILTVSANPGDISLTVSPDPEVGFAGTAGATIPSDQIQIQKTQGAAPNLTVPITVKLVSPLVVTTAANNQLDLEFDLAHPAFLIGHVPPGAGTTIWAVNFDGPVRHRPLHHIDWLVLRHLYGDATAVSSDNTSITVTKEFPTEPPTNPETAIASTLSLQILADATNGTIFYDVDAKTRNVIKDFSTEAPTIVGRYVRIAARYQEDGTLVAVRIWASNEFNNVWVSPEGHVWHVNTSTNVITVADETGRGVPLSVDANTQFFFRQPQNGLADATPIATGTAFLSSHDLVRGFKVHASVVDPLAVPLVAQTIDIETAVYQGRISAPDMTGFTYTKNFRTASDDYVFTLDYIAGASANGEDDMGNAITGYKWWNFAYPTLLNSGTGAIGSFVSATDGAVTFGGSVGAVPAEGFSAALWNDPANAGGWAAAATVLSPSTLPLGEVASGLVSNVFTMIVSGGATAASIAVDTSSGSATLVYQVDRTNGVVTVSPIDITTSTGLATLTGALVATTPVKVYGVPQANGTLMCYVLVYFTGDAPAQ